MKGAGKIQKQGYYPANLNYEITVYNCNRKRHGWFTHWLAQYQSEKPYDNF